MKYIRDVLRTSPTPTKVLPRTIPENSKVKRILNFGDDEPVKNVKHHSIIDSIEDVNRILDEDAIRGALRWNYDIVKDEPTDGNWSWETEIISVGDRKRKFEDDTQDINEHESRKLRRMCSLEDRPLEDIKSIAEDENTVNSLMDNSRECYAEGIQHWNFDFDEEGPLEGPVEWIQVGPHWVGNKPGTSSRVVLNPVNQNNVKDGNIIKRQENNIDAKIEANNNAVKLIDLDELLTETVNVVYGDWHKELNIGVKTLEVRSINPFIDGEMHNHLNLLLNRNEHRQIDKDTVVKMIKKTDNVDLKTKEVTDENLNEVNNKAMPKTGQTKLRIPGGLFLPLY